MRISDWSSDVCSSDLQRAAEAEQLLLVGNEFEMRCPQLRAQAAGRFVAGDDDEIHGGLLSVRAASYRRKPARIGNSYMQNLEDSMIGRIWRGWATGAIVAAYRRPSGESVTPPQKGKSP